jgi:hypothetical protein
MSKRLVTNERESDGRFALRLESAAAVQRDQLRSEAKRRRAAQIEAENADWAKAHNVAVEDLGFLFA